MTPRDLDQGRAGLSALRPFRREVYSFLAGAFTAPPSEETLASLRSEAFLQITADLFGVETLSGLREYASAAEPDGDLQREYMNLFRVPGAQYVTPYESVYRDTREVAGGPVKGLLMGQSAIDVQQWYRLARFSISDEFGDLPDHIGLELNFLADVCAKEQELEDAGDLARLERAWEMERDFLAGHVSVWIDSLSEKILARSEHPFFRLVAQMTREFVRRELATLEEVIGPSEGNSVPTYGEVGT